MFWRMCAWLQLAIEHLNGLVDALTQHNPSTPQSGLLNAKVGHPASFCKVETLCPKCLAVLLVIQPGELLWRVGMKR